MSVKWQGEELLTALRPAIMRGVIRGAQSVLEAGNLLIMTGPKTGRVYRRRGVTHRASAPGQPPASDTGTLVNQSRVDYDFENLSATVHWSAAYAAFLEFGTVKMEARPFARPALESRRQSIQQDIADEVAKALATLGAMG